MNIAVVDDEEAIREQISGFIKKRNPDFNISGFATGEGLLAAGKDFDIIFLDIQMEGMGGIEAARTLRQSGVDAVVIFITGIREYVFEAFDVSAFHYLLKPIEEQKFMEVLCRAAEEAGRTPAPFPACSSTAFDFVSPAPPTAQRKFPPASPA